MTICDLYKFQKGEVWYFQDKKDEFMKKEFGERGILQGSRYVLIISNSLRSTGIQNRTITYVPISKCSAKNEVDHVKFYDVEVYINEYPSYICCNQIQTTSTENLTKYIGRLSNEKLKEVDFTLGRYLDMIKGVTCLDEEENVVKIIEEDKTDNYKNHTSEPDISSDFSKAPLNSDYSIKKKRKKAYKVLYIPTNTEYKSILSASKDLNINRFKIKKELEANDSTVFKYID